MYYYKKLFFFCALFVIEVKSDCHGIECFSDFFTNFFTNNSPVEYVNTTTQNLPENFVQVKDVVVSDFNKVLSDISSFIKHDITDRLKAQTDAIFPNVNPETKIYVKTFNYKNFDNIDFDNVNPEELEEKIDFDEFDKDVQNKKNATQNQVKITKISEVALNNVKKVDKVELREANIQNKTKNITQQKEKIENRASFTPKTVASKLNHKHVSENEIPKTDDIIYYDFNEDNSTDYPNIDYIEIYKDTTNEENVATESAIQDEVQASFDEYTVGLQDIIWDINNNSDSSQNTTVDPSDVYPWIAAIFLKNDSMKNQFEYYCDGALLNNNVLITAARCVHVNNSTVDPNDVLVILGKRSLLTMDQRERAVKIKQIIPHENFTNANGKVVNDLAILVLDDTIYFNEVIQSANIGNDTRDVERLVTTAWDQQGDIVPVYLDDKENQACNSRDAGKSMFCATYGLDVALCPSYGGIFAAKQEDFWFLYGIRSGDTTDRGVCIDKHVWFTDLREYQGWIGEYL